MALRQQLIQKLEQRLSPQQIQLMKLLQVPTMELDQRIKQELEENPALEEGQEHEEDDFDNQDDFDSDDDNDDLDVDEEGAMKTPRFSEFGSGYVAAGTNSNRPVTSFSLGRYRTAERTFLVAGPEPLPCTRRELDRSSN